MLAHLVAHSLVLASIYYWMTKNGICRQTTTAVPTLRVRAVTVVVDVALAQCITVGNHVLQIANILLHAVLVVVELCTRECHLPANTVLSLISPSIICFTQTTEEGMRLETISTHTPRMVMLPWVNAHSTAWPSVPRLSVIQVCGPLQEDSSRHFQAYDCGYPGRDDRKMLVHTGLSQSVCSCTQSCVVCRQTAAADTPKLGTVVTHATITATCHCTIGPSSLCAAVRQIVASAGPAADEHCKGHP
eukprot:GHUV01027134.1.p1 GENE.GHUV01027134.1~~GHUV01027134.1.p1  ORF type:complete len:246 (-),score=28.00 GHUV01027134.1:270-1007(-)